MAKATLFLPTLLGLLSGLQARSDGERSWRRSRKLWWSWQSAGDVHAEPLGEAPKAGDGAAVLITTHANQINTDLLA
ncbi:hypothetical protein, partial [Methylobacterium crusticola]|uniref:hypothetical protein n=1 Tax=Methylobacterium crusticola TaxID=1697972 RepID=UPI00193A2B3D